MSADGRARQQNPLADYDPENKDDALNDDRGIRRLQQGDSRDRSHSYGGLAEGRDGNVSYVGNQPANG